MTPLHSCTFDCVCSRAKACFRSGNEIATRSLTLSPASRELLWQSNFLDSRSNRTLSVHSDVPEFVGLVFC